MICAFAASAAVISGDHEKCVRIGDLISEGHMSSNLFESPNKLPHESDPTLHGGVVEENILEIEDLS
jgi:hypothetical protein